MKKKVCLLYDVGRTETVVSSVHICDLNKTMEIVFESTIST